MLPPSTESRLLIRLMYFRVSKMGRISCPFPWRKEVTWNREAGLSVPAEPIWSYTAEYEWNMSVGMNHSIWKRAVEQQWRLWFWTDLQIPFNFRLHPSLKPHVSRSSDLTMKIRDFDFDAISCRNSSEDDAEVDSRYIFSNEGSSVSNGEVRVSRREFRPFRVSHFGNPKIRTRFSNSSRSWDSEHRYDSSQWNPGLPGENRQRNLGKPPRRKRPDHAEKPGSKETSQIFQIIFSRAIKTRKIKSPQVLWTKL